MALTPQNFFSTGFTPATPDTTGARGSDSGRHLQFGNVLAGDASANLSTGAPGSHDSGTVIDAGTTVSATDPFGYLNGSDAPQVHGSSGTSEPTGSAAIVSGTANPMSTGTGRGTVTNGSQRISDGR